MMKFLRYFLCMGSLFFCELSFCCPACAGTLNNPNDKYVLLVIGIFIAFTYIPFYLIWRLIIKNRNLNKISQK
jgi:hypothetical protein